METMFIDLDDKMVAAVIEENRKKISYICSLCKPESDSVPCVKSCTQKAITTIWKPKQVK
jgi:Fe-S-cluster-containing hydrogenase component 2